MITTENNKLIAEFMGFPLHENGYGDTYVELHEDDLTPIKELLYHSSWDWLMPVVEKIESIEVLKDNFTDYYDVWVMPDAIRINIQSNEADPMILINKSEGVGYINHEIHLFEDKLTATYKAVVEFIKWYNENK